MNSSSLQFGSVLGTYTLPPRQAEEKLATLTRGVAKRIDCSYQALISNNTARTVTHDETEPSLRKTAESFTRTFVVESFNCKDAKQEQDSENAIRVALSRIPGFTLSFTDQEKVDQLFWGTRDTEGPQKNTVAAAVKFALKVLQC